MKFKVGNLAWQIDYGLWDFFFVPERTGQIRVEAYHGASMDETYTHWHTFGTFRSFAKYIWYMVHMRIPKWELTSERLWMLNPQRGAIAVTQHKILKQTASGTTCPITITSTGASHILAVSGYNRNSRTISSVSDNIGTGTWTHATSANGSDSGANNTADSYYNLGPGSGVTTVTVQFSGVAGTDARTCECWEVSGFTTPVFDVGGATLNATGSANTDTGPTLARTGTNSFSYAGCNSSGSTSAFPKASTGWTAGGDLSGDFVGGFASDIQSTTGNVTPIATDGSAATSFTITAASIKESSGGATAAFNPRRLRMNIG